MAAENIDKVILSSGSTRISKVIECFGDKEHSKGINPDRAIVYGTAVQGDILFGEIITDDACPCQHLSSYPCH